MYPFLPLERATTPLSVPEPPPPAPATNDDDKFDVPVDPEHFSYPPLPSSNEMDGGIMVVEEAIRAAPANTLTFATARGLLRPRGRSRGSSGRTRAHHGGESRVQEGFQSQWAVEAVEGIEVKAVSLLALQQESFAYTEMESMASFWQAQGTNY